MLKHAESERERLDKLCEGLEKGKVLDKRQIADLQHMTWKLEDKVKALGGKLE